MGRSVSLNEFPSSNSTLACKTLAGATLEVRGKDTRLELVVSGRRHSLAATLSFALLSQPFVLSLSLSVGTSCIRSAVAS